MKNSLIIASCLLSASLYGELSYQEMRTLLATKSAMTTRPDHVEYNLREWYKVCQIARTRSDWPALKTYIDQLNNGLTNRQMSPRIRSAL